MDDLNASLDSFLVEPPVAGIRGRVFAAEDTEAGYTCNVKCGPSAYWECYTLPEWGCIESYDACQTGNTCYPVCATQYAPGDPYC
jgi:hypothetical protein